MIKKKLMKTAIKLKISHIKKDTLHTEDKDKRDSRLLNRPLRVEVNRMISLKRYL